MHHNYAPKRVKGIKEIQLPPCEVVANKNEYERFFPPIRRYLNIFRQNCGERRCRGYWRANINTI